MRHVDFDDALHTTYATGRSLSPDVVEQWMQAVATCIDPSTVERVIDLGAGTGRFSTHLAATLAARVIAVDPARSMLRQVDRGIECVAARAERLPFPSGVTDLVFASMVIHHFDDFDVAAAEILRVLRPRGHLLVRTCFADSLDPPYHRFFPSVGGIDRSLLPTESETIHALGESGLELVRKGRVRQRMARSWREYAERIRQRAMSPLRLISDEEFAVGMAALDEAAAQEVEPAEVYEVIDLLDFRALR
jgi:ubiquinone/menaquinone biosynthesis C-methylase UbiE